MQRYIREKPPQAVIAKRIGVSTSGNGFYEGLGSWYLFRYPLS